MEQYQVDYLINVQADAATKSLTSFAQAMGRMKGLDTRLANLARSAETLTTALNQLPKNGYRIKVTIPEKTTQAINTLRTQLQNLKKLATAPMTVKINTANALRSLQTLETRVTRLSAKMKSIGIGSIGAVAPTPGAPIGRGGSLAYTPIASQRFTPAQIRQAYGRQIGPMRGQTANIGGRNVPVWGAAPAGMMGPGGYLSYTPQNNSRVSTQNSQQRKQQAIQSRASTTRGESESVTIPKVFRYVAPRLSGTRRRAAASPFGRANNRYSANALGHAEIVNPMALNMLKGMGIAYGLSGIMSLTGGVIRDATDYNNMMQTAKNILQSNDQRPNFANRVKSMEKVIRQIGVETKFTAPETANAARYLAMAGLNVETIKAAMPSIADLALIGDSDLGATADVVTNIMTAYGIHPDRMRNAADIMTRTFTMSNTTLMEIAESYKYSASLLAAAGIPFAESAGAIGVLGDAGIKASQAGTSLRTILNNIVKPTKSQREMWQKLGIKRFEDEDASGNSATGKMRSLLDIFTDLNRQNVSVDTYYKLFRLTAAQGAAALAMHVDKWRDIAERNGESEGLSQRLAGAKKNTVQGLWAQVTSSFTEQGIRAFESKQGDITDVLKKFTVVLQSESTQNAIQGLTDRLWGLGSAIVDFSKKVGRAFSVMAGPVDGFIRVELWAGALAILARSLKSIVNVGGMGLNWFRQLGTGAAERTAWTRRTINAWQNGNTGLQTIFRSRNRAGRLDNLYANLQSRGFSKADIKRLQAGQFVPPSRIRQSNGRYAAGWRTPQSQAIYENNRDTYNANTAAHIERWERLYRRKYGAAAIFRSGVGSTMAGGVLGALGGIVGSQMFGENNPVGSLVGAAALGGAGYVLPSVLAGTTMSGWAMTGIGAGVAALMGIALWMQTINKRAHEAAVSISEFSKSVNMVNGVHVMEGDYLSQHMSVVASTTMTANEQLREHIRLLKEEMGIATPEDSGQSNGDQSFADISAERSKRLRDAYIGIKPWKTLDDIMSHDKRLDTYEEVNAVLHQISPGTSDIIPDDRTFWGMRAHVPQAVKDLLLWQAATNEANLEAQRIVDDFDHRIKIAAPEARPAIVQEFLDKINSVTTARDNSVTNHISDKDVRHQTIRWSDDWTYNYTLLEQLRAHAPLYDAFSQVTTNPNDQNMMELLYRFGIFTMNPALSEQGIKIGSPEWYKYYSNNFQKAEGEVNLDEAWTRNYLNAVETVNGKLLGSKNELNQALKLVRDIFAPYVKDAQRPANGWTVTDEQGTWTYRELEDDMYNAATKQSIPWATGGFNAPVAGSDSSDMASEYSSAYESASASPKQVVINIESLMNVDAVNMGDPDVENTLANLRESMATVLMGVVSDFTQQYQNS